MATPNSIAAAGSAKFAKPPVPRAASDLVSIVLGWEDKPPDDKTSSPQPAGPQLRSQGTASATMAATEPKVSFTTQRRHSDPGKNIKVNVTKKRKKRRKSKTRVVNKVVKKKSIRAKPKRAKKNRAKGYPPRSKSTNSRPRQPQTRTLRSDMSSTGVYKTHSDTALGGTRTTTNNPPTGTQTRRRYRSAGSGNCQSLEEIVDHIIKKQAKNIVVMAGAGISTPSGIPDFRTPGTGLYDNLRQYRIPYAQAIFDIDYFERNPKPFYTLAKELYPSGKYRPNYVHYFIRMLHEKGLLLRLYTQNIDGLERMAGIPAAKLVEAHGSFLTASCTRCKAVHSHNEVKDVIFAHKMPRCKRDGCKGLVKPDIVFFGEDLPRRFYYYLRDFPQADMLIVMGTSLEVEPFAGIVDAVRIYVPRVLFNREAVGPFERKRRMNDVVVEGDVLEKVKMFARLLGWKKDLDNLITEETKKLETLYAVEHEVVNANNASNNNTEDMGQQDSLLSDLSLPSRDFSGSISSLEITSVQEDSDSITSDETSSTATTSTSDSSDSDQSRSKVKRSGTQVRKVINTRQTNSKNSITAKQQKSKPNVQTQKPRTFKSVGVIRQSSAPERISEKKVSQITSVKTDLKSDSVVKSGAKVESSDKKKSQIQNKQGQKAAKSGKDTPPTTKVQKTSAKHNENAVNCESHLSIAQNDNAVNEKSASATNKSLDSHKTVAQDQNGASLNAITNPIRAEKAVRSEVRTDTHRESNDESVDDLKSAMKNLKISKENSETSQSCENTGALEIKKELDESDVNNGTEKMTADSSDSTSVNKSGPSDAGAQGAADDCVCDTNTALSGASVCTVGPNGSQGTMNAGAHGSASDGHECNTNTAPSGASACTVSSQDRQDNMDAGADGGAADDCECDANTPLSGASMHSVSSASSPGSKQSASSQKPLSAEYRRNVAKYVTERLYKSPHSINGMSRVTRTALIVRKKGKHSAEKTSRTKLRRPTQQMQSLSAKSKRDAEVVFNLARHNALKDKQDNLLPKLSYKHRAVMVASGYDVNSEKNKLTAENQNQQAMLCGVAACSGNG